MHRRLLMAGRMPTRPVSPRPDVDVERCNVTLFKLLPGDCPDGGVVGAQLQRRDQHGHPTTGGECLEFPPQQSIGGHSATDGHHAAAGLGDSEVNLGHERIDSSLLERSCQIGPLLQSQLAVGHPRRPHLIANGRLETTETEIEPRAIIHQGPRKAMCQRVALSSQPFNLRSPRVAKSKQAGGLVEGLTDGIVNGAAKPLELQRISHLEKRGVASAHHEADRGELQGIAEGDSAGIEMSGNVVIADQWQPMHGSNCLGGREADQQRPDQPRPHGDSNGLKAASIDVRNSHSFVDNRDNPFDMSP